MLDFTKKLLLRTILIAAAVLCCYPELSLAVTHHHAKIKHARQFKRISHAGKSTKHKQVKSVTPVTADNIQFTIGANHTIVANNVVIPAPPAPEETGIEILSETPSALTEEKTESSTPSPLVTLTQQDIPSVKPPVTAPAIVAAPVSSATHEVAVVAPRGYFQFQNNDAPAPVQNSAPVKEEPPHGFFASLKPHASAEPPTTTQTTVTKQVTTTDQPHGFFLFRNHETVAPTPPPAVMTQSTVTQQITATTAAPSNEPHSVTVTESQTNIQAPVASAPQAAQGFFLFHKQEPRAPTTTAVTQPVASAVPEQISPAPQHRFFHFNRDSGEPATVAVSVASPRAPGSTRVLGSIAASVQKHIVEFVKNTVTTLRYSDYKLGGSKFDTSKGVYIVDCSSFVDHILKNVSPHAYTSLVNATGAPTPATQHYYEFFKELSKNSDDYWNKVNNVEQLRAGDILVFRTKHNHGGAAGHVMVVMEKPIKDMDVYFVRVADSAPARHSEDTRQRNEGGIGIGTLLLKAAKSGRPSAYAWGIGGYWNKNVNFAMARPTEWN